MRCEVRGVRCEVRGVKCEVSKYLREHNSFVHRISPHNRLGSTLPLVFGCVLYALGSPPSPPSVALLEDDAGGVLGLSGFAEIMRVAAAQPGALGVSVVLRHAGRRENVLLS